MVIAAFFTDDQFRYLVDHIPTIIGSIGMAVAAVLSWRFNVKIGQVGQGVEDARTEAARASELTVATADTLARKTEQAQQTILSRVDDVHQTLSDPLRSGSSSGVRPVQVEVTNTPAHPVPTAPGPAPADPTRIIKP